MSIITKITTSGNSKAVRLPKALLQLTGIEDQVKLSVQDGAIVITPVKKRRPREGWAEQIDAYIKKYGPYESVIEDEWGRLDPNDIDEADLGELAEDEDWSAWR